MEFIDFLRAETFTTLAGKNQMPATAFLFVTLQTEKETKRTKACTAMKTKSLFKNLSPEDQQFVIDLCEKHTYNQAVEILARPRPGGLSLATSYSALCRFYTSFNAQARKISILSQAARTLQLARQASPNALRTAILTLLETHIFQSLQSGIPANQLKDFFFILKDFHRGFLSEEKWRAKRRDQEDLAQHRKATAQNPDCDFLPAEHSGETLQLAEAAQSIAAQPEPIQTTNNAPRESLTHEQFMQILSRRALQNPPESARNST